MVEAGGTSCATFELELENSYDQNYHRKRKHAVIARAEPMLFCGFDTHGANVSVLIS
jgi:hypothetical protein